MADLYIHRSAAIFAAQFANLGSFDNMVNFCTFPCCVPALESPGVFVELPEFGVCEEVNFTLQGRAEVHLKMKTEKLFCCS